MTKLTIEQIKKERPFSKECRQAIYQLKNEEGEEAVDQLFEFIENFNLDTFSTDSIDEDGEIVDRENFDSDENFREALDNASPADEGNFGTCDITDIQGNIVKIVVLDKNGITQHFECLEKVAYILHGMSGAY
jgi:hypothetical protein